MELHSPYVCLQVLGSSRLIPSSRAVSVLLLWCWEVLLLADVAPRRRPTVLIKNCNLHENDREKREETDRVCPQPNPFCLSTFDLNSSRKPGLTVAWALLKRSVEAMSDTVRAAVQGDPVVVRHNMAQWPSPALQGPAPYLLVTDSSFLFLSLLSPLLNSTL